MSIFFAGDHYKLTGLHLSTVYVMKAVSYNKSGFSKYSNQVLKKTANFPLAQESTLSRGHNVYMNSFCENCFIVLLIYSLTETMS